MDTFPEIKIKSIERTLLPLINQVSDVVQIHLFAITVVLRLIGYCLPSNIWAPIVRGLGGTFGERKMFNNNMRHELKIDSRHMFVHQYGRVDFDTNVYI